MTKIQNNMSKSNNKHSPRGDGEDSFKIKSYCMTELAQLYKPDVLPSSALKTFNGWIDKNPELKAGLAETGFIPGETRSLTPFQVRIIVYYLGDP